MDGTDRPLHLGYLDGVRGWAALYVVMSHVWQFTSVGPDYRPAARWFTVMSVFRFGAYAVAVFIVLSGYCLMLPVVRTRGTPPRSLRGGIGAFFARRSRRILPPYYAALALSIALDCTPWLSRKTVTQWDISLPAVTLASVLAHVTMVHNWWQGLEWKLNPPMWTVALEWQIYFVFALVLLPLWRRVGPLVTVVVAFALGMLPALFGAEFAATWLLGGFALGMLAAETNFTSEPRLRRALTSGAWRAIAISGSVLVVVTMGVHHRVQIPPMISDTVVALTATAWFIVSTHRMQEGAPLPLVMRLFARPISTGLGEFSYSLYLTHYPLIAIMYLVVRLLKLSPEWTFFALAASGVPVALAVAYAFHRIAERPFMSRAPAANGSDGPFVVRGEV